MLRVMAIFPPTNKVSTFYIVQTVRMLHACMHGKAELTVEQRLKKDLLNIILVVHAKHDNVCKTLCACPVVGLGTSVEWLNASLCSVYSPWPLYQWK